MDGEIFISYSRDDSTYAQRLYTFLTELNLRCFIDTTSIRVGDPFSPKIQERISTCAALIVIMTPASAKSEWVDREVATAVAHGRPVVPLLLDGAPLNRIATLSFADVRGGAMPGADVVAQLKAFAASAPAVIRPGAGAPLPVIGRVSDARQGASLAIGGLTALVLGAMVGSFAVWGWGYGGLAIYLAVAVVALFFAVAAFWQRWFWWVWPAVVLGVVLSGVLLVALIVLWWRAGVDHQPVGLAPLAAFFGALGWAAGAGMLRAALREDYDQRVRAATQDRIVRLAQTRVWLSGGQSPAVLQGVLRDSARGGEFQNNSFFGYFLVAGQALVLVDDSGRTDSAGFQSMALTRARAFRHLSPPVALLALDSVPVATSLRFVEEDDRVEVFRVPPTEFELAAGRLLAQGDAVIYLPLLERLFAGSWRPGWRARMWL